MPRSLKSGAISASIRSLTWKSEVEGEHEYFAGEQRVLSHNSGTDTCGSSFLPKGTFSFKFGRLKVGNWEAPPIIKDRHGKLTNGSYTLDGAAMEKHLQNLHPELNKSQFTYRMNVENLTLDAAAYADKAGLWVASKAGEFPHKAKIIFDHLIGTHGKTGQPTFGLNLYRNASGHVHASPASPL
jgi:hypothetical protein